MLKLLRLLDRVLGYAYIPRPKPGSSSTPGTTEEALRAYPLPQLTGVQDVADVQEKWVDNKLDWEEWEGRRREEGERERRGAGVEGARAGKREEMAR